MKNNAEKLYKIISEDKEKKQSLFRTALTNPKSALKEICKIGEDLNIKVSEEEVIEHLSTLDDIQTKLWLIKVRGGL
tara:strand:+ start:1300 stop:1530 length:231 start_codon:yes stop_codon:yes gene_type:complete